MNNFPHSIFKEVRRFSRKRNTRKDFSILEGQRLEIHITNDRGLVFVRLSKQRETSREGKTWLPEKDFTFFLIRKKGIKKGSVAIGRGVNCERFPPSKIKTSGRVKKELSNLERYLKSVH